MNNKTLALCREIADWLRAVAMDGDDHLALVGRREVVEIALVGRHGAREVEHTLKPPERR